MTTDTCEGQVMVSLSRVQCESGEIVEVTKIEQRLAPIQEAPIDEVREFDAAIGFRWTWEDAETVDRLEPSDKEAIRQEIEKLARLIEFGNPEAVVAFRSGWLPRGIVLPRGLADPKQVKPEWEQKLIRSIGRVETAPASSLRFCVGTKFVLVEGEDAPIVDSNVPTAFVWRPATQPSASGGTAKHLMVGEGQLYCVRVNGSWRIMMGNWCTTAVAGEQ